MKIVYEKGDVLIRESLPEDADNLKNMRQKDMEEIWAEGHFYPSYAISESISNSILSMTFIHKGNIVAVFGIVPDSALSKRARVWMLTSEQIYQTQIAFLKAGKLIIAYFLGLYPTLWNLVDARYKESIEWLKWNGAKIFDPKPYGIDNLEFSYFTIERTPSWAQPQQ